MAHQLYATVDIMEDYNHREEPPTPPPELNLRIERSQYSTQLLSWDVYETHKN